MRTTDTDDRRVWRTLPHILLLLILTAVLPRVHAAEGPSWDYPEVTWFEWDTWRWHPVVDDEDWEDVDDDGTAEYVGRADEDEDLEELAEHIESTAPDRDGPTVRSVWPRWDDSSRRGWSDLDYDPTPADADSEGPNDPTVVPDIAADEWDDVEWSDELD